MKNIFFSKIVLFTLFSEVIIGVYPIVAEGDLNEESFYQVVGATVKVVVIFMLRYGSSEEVYTPKGLPGRDKPE